MAIVSATALMIGTVGLSPSAAVGNFQDEAAESAASILASSVGGNDLVGVAATSAGLKSSPGANNDALNVDVLGDQVVQFGDVSIPLNDVIDFGAMGALGSSSEAGSATATRSVSGLLAEGGSVKLSGDDASFGAATINLLSLSESAGVEGLTDLAIDQLELKLGAFGSEVVVEDGKILDPDGVGGPGQYRVGQADLLLRSPLVGDAANGIYGAAGAVDTTVEDLVNKNLDVDALTGLVSGVPGVPTPTVTVDSNMQDTLFQRVLNQPITSHNKVVTIDFSTGELQIHLDQVVGKGGLNAQEPNAELISSEIYPLIAESIHDIMHDITNLLVGAIEDSLNAVTITVQFADDKGLVGGNLDVTWTFTLADIASGDLGEVTDNSSGLIGGTAGTALATAIQTLGSTVGPVLAPVYELIISDAGDHIFELVINDIKFGITSSIVNMLSPLFEVLNGFVSLQVNHQEIGTCENSAGEDVTNSLDLSALSLGLARSADGGRLNLGNSSTRFTPVGCSS
ncbi:choice-of-anchor G family protein [Microlunatus speluncae]|uniref:choice-of-anchor G family protein n=1 Tax=Microlunatus speluncae TaxID=2594267 RepID=UPI00137633FC|nr:choice-of-anchor G family protein [Microlunatus speluncae]